ncbi:MAG: DUF2973 domain-containing protein [Jaaginema sp. PMC 1079.18]|nr:DUF2973 domain-containing protein [Jaaginema sp. PMC 1080.18]MEC4852104.1 DUF2973 domain-containing protein [Jaaginema sp. PMC 1079.18]MEC4866441.1 DUF2973 domain-containing protein [Jaaginema sp. PMC 1078.18]
MLHLLYILAFTIIAFFAISNLIRSLVTVSLDSQRRYPGNNQMMATNRRVSVPHPELLDSDGQPIREPLLIVKSMDVEDAREKLDAIYNSSPSQMVDRGEEG